MRYITIWPEDIQETGNQWNITQFYGAMKFRNGIKKASEFLNHHLQPIMKQGDTYIRDT